MVMKGTPTPDAANCSTEGPWADSLALGHTKKAMV